MQNISDKIFVHLNNDNIQVHINGSFTLPKNTNPVVLGNLNIEYRPPCGIYRLAYNKGTLERLAIWSNGNIAIYRSSTTAQETVEITNQIKYSLI